MENQNRKFNWKRLRDTFIWVMLISGISVLLYFSIQKKSNARVKSLEVNIEGVSESDHLISEKEVLKILTEAAGKPITKANISTLNLRRLESKLNKDKRIERADIYFNSNNRLNVRIIQKKPVMRVIDNAGTEYYLDENGKKVPVTRGSAVRVPVVTGIKDTFNVKMVVSDKPSKMKDVFIIMKYIAQDEFLSALIEQAHVENDSTGDIVLVPKIGRQKLIFGSAQDMEAKFDNLKIFYRDGLPKRGWNRDKTLNLKYTNQVIATLVNPQTAERIHAAVSDSLQASLINSVNNNKSIHH
jgi:cell division protein FtsQ